MEEEEERLHIYRKIKLKRQWNSFENEDVRHKIVVNKNLKKKTLLFSSHLLLLLFYYFTISQKKITTTMSFEIWETKKNR